MTGLLAAGAGATVYLVVLAALGYLYGERPGDLQRTLSHLRGEPPADRRPGWRLPAGPLTRRQQLALTLTAAVVLAAAGFLMFRSWLLTLLVTLAAPLYPRFLERTWLRKRRELMTAQFGLALQAMASSLRAGASLRTAVERSAANLNRMLAGQPATPMVAELEQVVRDLQMGLSLEEALVRLRDRVQLEDVTDFVNAVLLCRVRGGNAAQVMAGIAEIIEDKITVSQQILTLTAGKRAEAALITFGPPCLVVYLSLTSPEYMAPLYESFTGQVLMLAGAGCLAASYFIGRRLLEIDV